MKIPVQQTIQAGFAVALGFLCLVGATAWWSTQRNIAAFASVDAIHEVRNQLDNLVEALLGVESRSRGYAVSGDAALLPPLQARIAAEQEALAAVKRLTRDDPAQQTRLTALEALLRRKDGVAEAIVQWRRGGDTAAALRMIASGEDSRAMDAVRQLIGAIDQAEARHLQRETARARAASRVTLGAVALGSLLSFGLIALAGIIVRRDFEKRQRAEAERDRFFTLSLDMFCIARTDGFFKRVNPAFTATLGWSVEELLARPFLEFVHPDDRPETLREAKKIAGGQPTLFFRNRYHCKDGSWRVLSWKAVPQPGGLVFATVRDETALQQAEAALHHSEEDLAVTLQSIGDAVLATDRQRRITRMNAVAEQLTGWKRAEAQGRPIGEVFRIINEETLQPAVIPVDEVLQTGLVHGLANHTVLLSRDGTERAIADSAAPIRDQDGHTLGVVLVFRDVTEDRRAERALLESERRFRALNEELERQVAERTAEIRQAMATLDATLDAVLIFDPETLRHTYVNEGAVQQVGYTREELLGMTVLDIKPEFDEPRLRQMLAPMLRGEVHRHLFTTRHRHKDGHDIPVEINLQYIAPAGERPRFIAIVRDIAERLKHERLALRSQRLESIGTLAGGVAHDLNNALAPILMSLEVLRLEYPGESEVVDTIQTCTQRGADMVRQLLSFAKGAGGERVFLQPGRQVKELENLMKSSFPKNIRLLVRHAPQLPNVLGDPTQLHQVLLNLCVNARDAMPGGGTLTLETLSMYVDAALAGSVPDAKPGNYVALRVRDTGTGIPPESIDLIFDPFFTTKGPDKGTGLGLSTVQGIVKGHGGFLQVDSRPGRGSTFTVYLPAEKAVGGDPGLPARQAAEYRGHGGTILFVDDEAAVREMASMVLRRLGFKPLTATDGADGLVKTREQRAGLRAIVTDLHMPQMDGLAFVRALRRLLPDIPVVVASGRMDEEVAGEFKLLGVTRRLDKPFTEAQLAETLRNLLEPE